nr:MAG TPA: hypothetical protein [Caudoviricetes sp.]
MSCKLRTNFFLFSCKILCKKFGSFKNASYLCSVK